MDNYFHHAYTSIAPAYAGAADCRQRPRHSAEDFSLKEAKSQYFQDF